MSRSTVTYQELSHLESEFDDFQVDLLRYQVQREAPLYARRAALVRRIASFWPLVFEQAPAEIDQYIQPTDANVLMSALQSIDVERFDAEKGDPRSIAIKFTFGKNEYFEDSVIEKRFWYRQQAPSADELAKIAARNEKAKARRAKSGKPLGDDEDEEETPDNWAGLVSEPVAIKWKDGKDLTNGLLDLAVKVYQDVVSGNDGKDEATQTENQKALAEQMAKTAVGAVSFFNWFGYVGRYITPEESAAATAADIAARKAIAPKWAAKAEKYASAGDAMDEDVKEEDDKEEEEEEEDEDDEDDDEDDDDEDYAFEIFADGDTVALGIAEDLWPNAIKYFYDAQEQDTLSELDFEGESDEDEDEAPPLKKAKN